MASRYILFSSWNWKRECVEHTFNSVHASSGPSVGADSSLVTLALLVVLRSNTGGGELALELDMFDDGLFWSSNGSLPSIDRGDEASSANRSDVDLLLVLLPPRLWAFLASSIDRRVGLKDTEEEAVAGGDAGVNRSCSAFVALRIQIVLPISVTVNET